jgi:hypothetical protein
MTSGLKAKAALSERGEMESSSPSADSSALGAVVQLRFSVGHAGLPRSAKPCESVCERAQCVGFSASRRQTPTCFVNVPIKPRI